MLREGKSEQEVIGYMVDRYGDFVLYRPPLKSSTWLLWGGPFALFIGGLIALFFKLKRRREQAGTPLSAEEQLVAARLLHGDFEVQK